MIGDLLKAVVTIKKEIYYNESTNWGIIESSINEVKEGVPNYNGGSTIICKGVMPKPVQGSQYSIIGAEVSDPKYGIQYTLSFMSSIYGGQLNDRLGQRKFLETIFTVGQVKEMYKTSPNPYILFTSGDIEGLVKIKGCGTINAIKWLEKFNAHVSVSKIYVELSNFNLSENTIKKLVKMYGSADLVIQKVKDDPYVLSNLEGIGFLRADNYALQGGIGLHSIKRVKAFITYSLEVLAEDGYSYIHPDKLFDNILETLGQDMPINVIKDAIYELTETLWWNEEKDKIGLRKFRTLEENIAKELLRLKTSNNIFNFTHWREKTATLEKHQGWNFTEEQISAIKMSLDNNVLVIHGLAGTGKSSVVDGIVKILSSYTIAQCALSGRAGARMKEITGLDSYTIHRLLGFPSNSIGAKNKFSYHDEHQLPFDIIILDEISMVDGYLFYNLIRAIPTGSKLIMLGDTGQLEPIGTCNIAYDMIQSPIIPTAYLSQIHRQASQSAIITESRKVYDKQPIISRDWTGIETRGVLQDLTLDCYSDNNNTFFKVMQYFSIELQKVKTILDLQVIVPIKNLGNANTNSLNNAIQELYNPESANKAEVGVNYGKDRYGILREGDKVINHKNKLDAINADTDEITAIFNGNIGIIETIYPEDRYLIINFIDIGRVIIYSDFITNIELGYAITVHKMQGSQNERAIVAIDTYSYALLNKNLLYTAITRAQKHCTLIAQSKALLMAICKDGIQNKLTHLQSILLESA